MGWSQQKILSGLALSNERFSAGRCKDRVESLDIRSIYHRGFILQEMHRSNGRSISVQKRLLLICCYGRADVAS